MTAICDQCEAEFETDNQLQGHKTAVHRRENGPRSEETKAKISASLEGYYEDNDVWNKGLDGYLAGEKNPAKRPEVRERLSETQQGERNSMWIDLPDTTPSKELAYILGALDGDGCVSGNESMLGGTDKEFVEKFRQAADMWGVHTTPGVYEYDEPHRKDMYIAKINATSVADWYRGLDYDDRMEFLSDKPIAWKYIEATYESEGCLKRPGTFICCTDRRRIDFLRNLLKNLNIVTTMHRKRDGYAGVYVRKQSAVHFFRNIDCCIARRAP